MSKRITLLAAAVLAAGLVGLVGAGCADQAQKKPKMTPAEAYAAMGTPMMILTVECEGPSAPAVEALGLALANPKQVYQAQAAQVLAQWAAMGDANLVIPALASKDPLVLGIAQATYIQSNGYGMAPLVVEGNIIDVPPTILTALAELRDPAGLVNLSKVIDGLREPLRSQMKGPAADGVLAADILARDGDAGARRVLIEIAKTAEGALMSKVARASVRDDMLLGPTILPAAMKGDLLAQRAVMTSLVVHPQPQLSQLLVRGFHSDDAAVRRNAIRAMANLSAAAPVDLMAAELVKITAAQAPSDRGTAEQGELIRALGVIGKPAAGALRDYVRKNTQSDDLQVAGLLAFGPSATAEDVPWIAKRLDSPNKYVRAAAATALGRTAHPSAQTALMAMANDSEPLVRAATAKALGLLGTVYASKQLAVMLDDTSPLVSSMAAWGLGTAGYPDAAAALEKTAKARVSPEATPARFGEVYGWPDLASVEAMGKIRNPAVLKFLRESMGSKSWVMRATAAQALATGDASADTIQLLEKAIKDPVNLVRAQALLSLKGLGKVYTEDQLMTLARRPAPRK